MKKIYLGLMVAIIIFITGCSNAPPKQVRNGETPTEINASQASEFYEAVGMGAPSADASNSASKKQTSFEAAKAAALNDIASYLYGVKLDSGITVQDAMAKDSTIKASVSAFIRGAEVIKREWDDENSCVVTMRINLKKFNQRLKELGIQ